MSKNQLDIEKAEVVSVMSTLDGRNTMYRILEWAGVDADSFNEDPYRHANTAGKRAVGLQLKNELQHADLDLYIKMVKEHE